MRRLTLLTLALGACETDPPLFQGWETFDHFPLDGSRTWKYSQDDPSIEWQLQVEKVEPTQIVDDLEIVTLEHQRGDTKDILYSVQWSSDSTRGILIHGYAEGAGEMMAFDPPIEFAEHHMVPGEFVETETGGATYTSTLVAQEDCPNHYADDWVCLAFRLEGTGLPFEGDYWIAPRFGTSLMRTTGYDQNWQLLDHQWKSGNE